MSDRTVSVGLRADVAGFVAGIRTAQREVSVFTDSLNKNAAKKQALTDLGNTAGKVGLIAAAGLGIAIKSAADFDSAMSSVEAATHASAGTMEDLRKAALEAGARTVYSATEAAGAIESLSKAGISAADIMGGGLNGALSLAAAGSIDVADAADAAATAMTQFNLSGKDIPHVADLLAAGAGKAQGEVSDMAMALKQSGLVASQFGMSIEETVGTLAAFASAGLLGSDAGTSFKTMLLRLANPSAGAAKTMERLGIAAYDANGAFIGTTALAGQLQKALQNKTQAERDAALATIFGSDAIRAANVLYKDGAAGIADWVTQTNDFNYANDTAAMKLDNLKGDLEKLSGALENAFIGTGDGAQGPLREMVQGVTALVDAFNSLPAPAKNTLAALAAITAVTGGGLWFGSKVIRGIADTREALKNLNVEAPRTARMMSAIGKASTVAIGVVALDAALKGLNDALEDGVPSGEKLTSQLLDLSDGKVKSLSTDFSDLAKNIDEIGTGGLYKVFDVSDSIPGISQAVGLVNNLLPGEGDQEQFRHFADQLEAIDGSLSGLVASGGPEKAKAAFEALASSLNLSAYGREELLKGLPQYQDALLGAANQTRLTSDATGELAGATGAMATKAAKAEARQKALADAIVKSRDAASDTAHEFFNLGDSLDKGKVSLNGWIHDLEKQAAALRDFRLNAEKAAKKGLREGLIAALQEAGPEGALRMKQLANATKDEIHRANEAWQDGQTEINRYTDAVGGVPKVVSTTVKVYTDTSTLDALQYRLSRMAAGFSIPVHAAQPKAFGGPITGGTPGRDSVPIMAMPGEHMLTKREVDALGGHAAVFALRRAALSGRREHGITRASGHSSGTTSVRVREGSMKVSGTLHIPGFGTAQIRGIAAEVFADEYGYEQSKGRMR